MGSVMTLDVGKFTLDYASGWRGNDHRALFQLGDRVNVPYYYAGGVIEEKPGCPKPLRLVRDRLELLGHTLRSAELEFENAASSCELGADVAATFGDLLRTLARLDVSSQDACDSVLGPGRGGREAVPLHPWTVLRMLAENRRSLEVPVQWRTADHVDAGWLEELDVAPALKPENRFLIATEGSTDARVLGQAMALLAPHVADFFYFIDMEAGYPFTGAGNLHKFCQGLASIGVLNRVLAVYDNDAEGCAKRAATSALRLPANMRAITLPDLPTPAAEFATIGPDGPGKTNVNGSAASIECFLDTAYRQDRPPVVHWSSYVPGAARWQGALERKEEYVRVFLSLPGLSPHYDFTRIRLVVDEVVRECIGLTTPERRDG